ncbi:putative nuclease HARBI1 [Ruditapes philippinarum]|uniref:putative nuclease HARBI1 n=1 Tax=Ruditapes philippinarum TaxID=129788 RepID=UPI00295AD993|nr:putative nuclease HARBI1 [Ruditapes philippinarum]
MEIEQLQLWARWLELQRDRAIAVLELEQEEEAEGRRHRRRRQMRRKIWMKQWLARRPLYGHYEQLLQELNREDPKGYKNFLRVDADMFGELVDRISPRIQKKNTNFREALEPGLKLAVTLRHLATGASYSDLMYSFRVGSNTISKFVPEVLDAIIQEYSEEVLPAVVTAEQWQQIADDFRTKWNFPHVCGALDGKHVRIKNPKNSGSLFYNYKGFFSIILLALVDANYKFIWVSVGANGSASDAQLFNNTELRTMLEENNLGLPDPDPLPGDDMNTPYFLIGDDAFPLRTWMMKPYSRRNLTNEERIFNYRLSRARRVVENAFGLLAMRFQCLLGCLNQMPETVDLIILACVTLHNLISIRYPAIARLAVDQEDEHNH